MVWGAFCSYGKLSLAFPSTKMNSQEYQGVLKDNLLPFLRSRRRISFTFQQDNASVHVSNSTKAWLEERHIVKLDWPSCSPDCNPMENMWGMLVRRVYAHNRQFNSVPELKAAILNEWGNLDNALVPSLIDSMPNRIFQLIQRHGGLIPY
jgi:hypothetical protein